MHLAQMRDKAQFSSVAQKVSESKGKLKVHGEFIIVVGKYRIYAFKSGAKVPCVCEHPTRTLKPLAGREKCTHTRYPGSVEPGAHRGSCTHTRARAHTVLGARCCEGPAPFAVALLFTPSVFSRLVAVWL